MNGPKGESKKEKVRKEAGSGSQMNMRGVFLHVLADALGSVVVIISALIMWQTEWEYKIYVDPALSLLLVCIMMKVGEDAIYVLMCNSVQECSFAWPFD